MFRKLSSSAVLLLVVLLLAAPSSAAIIANHTAADQFMQISDGVFQQVRDAYSIFYGHTSHGSQIVSGLGLLEDDDPVLYGLMPLSEYGDDLGHNGDISWVQPTRNYLDQHPECNVAMWSWCGGCSDNTEAGIAAYLAAMNSLESEYPAVHFIYMTGHLDGGGVDGNLYRSNNQIREYCLANDKVLFDFADVESWDPDGNYYPDETDACQWCSDWCNVNPCPSCSCAHSHCFNCYRKGMAFWWLMARVHGWNPVTDARGVVSGSEMQTQLKPAYPNPFNPSTTLGFRLTQDGTMRLHVMDAAGRVVAMLAKGYHAAGDYQVVWNGRDRRGRTVPSGTYLAVLAIEGEVVTSRLTVLK